MAERVLREPGSSRSKPADLRSVATFPENPEQESELHYPTAWQGCFWPQPASRHGAGAALAAANHPAAGAPEHAGDHDYVFLSSIIREHIDELFPGLEVSGCYQFRVTRNSNLYVDDEEVNDLVRELEGQLEASRYGAAVRLEVGHECPEDLQQFLLDHFRLQRLGYVPRRRSGQPEPPGNGL